MAIVENSEIENNELICPITLESIRDPVIAKDGYVYEREAIKKWIVRNGRSPLTRQLLRVNALETYDPSKHLTAQRRDPTGSDNNHLAKGAVCSLPSISLNIAQSQTEQSDSIIEDDQSPKVNCKPCLNLFLSLLIIFIIVIVVIPTVLLRHSNTSDIPSYITYETKAWTRLPKPLYYSMTWSSALTIASKKLVSNATNETYYYEEIKVVPLLNVRYIFEGNSTIPLCAYLYNKNFTGNLYENLLRYDENINGHRRFHISYFLQFLKSYTLVIKSGYANTTGRFNIIVSTVLFPPRIALYKTF